MILCSAGVSTILIFSMMAGTLIRRVTEATLGPKTQDSDEKHGK
jgi:hypothetical protein